MSDSTLLPIWKNTFVPIEKYKPKHHHHQSPNIKRLLFPSFVSSSLPFQPSHLPLIPPHLHLAMLFKSIVSLALVAAAAAQTTKGKAFDHIFIVFLENTVWLHHGIAMLFFDSIHCSI